MALQEDNDFWRFSLAVYEAPGVEAECLALQDALGIDVNLLLFCAWLGAARRTALTNSEVERARQAAQSWHNEAVRPLRAVRQRLKNRYGPDGEAFRTRLKALELEAEQFEQAMLFAHASETWPRIGSGDPRESLLANIRTFLQMQGAAGSEHGAASSTRHLVEAALQIAG